jgi:hypothetical protein
VRELVLKHPLYFGKDHSLTFSEDGHHTRSWNYEVGAWRINEEGRFQWLEGNEWRTHFSGDSEPIGFIAKSVCDWKRELDFHDAIDSCLDSEQDSG